MSHRLSSALCLALILLAVVPTLAQDVHQHATRSYRVDQWTPADGLPIWQVRDMVEGPNGYLWIATPVGLVRFDGITFHRIDRSVAPELPTNRIQMVHATASGEIWFGGLGFVVRLIEGEHVEPITNVDGLPHAAAQDSTGRIWLYHGAGKLGYVDEGSLVPASERAEGFVVDAGGRMWLREADGAITEVSGDRRLPSAKKQTLPVNPFWVLHRQPLIDSVERVPLSSEYQQGSIVVRDGSNRLIASVPANDEAQPWIVDQHGQLWVSRKGRVEAYTNESTAPVYSTTLGEDLFVSEILEDREGNIWVGTRAQGIFRLRPSIIERVQTEGASLFRGFVQLPTGELFVDAEQGLCRIDRDRLVPYETSRGGRSWRPFQAHIDPQGNIWLGDETEVRSSDGRRFATDLVGYSKLVPSRSDGFWFSDYGGLFWIDLRAEAAELKSARFEDQIKTRAVLHVDRQERLWVATQSGLFRADGEQLVPFESFGGVANVDIRAFHEDADGALWMGTSSRGLLRFKDERLVEIGLGAGLPESGVFAILEDGQGRLWMSGNRGIFRVTRDSLNRYCAGEMDAIESAHFVSDSGVLNPEEGSNLGIRAKDGRLWFSAHNEVLSIDPKMADEFSSVAPRVRLERLLVDEEPIAAAATGAYELSPQQRSFAVEFTAISMRDPELLQFESRLDPLDDRWSRIGTDRHMRYSNIAPGKYTFRVRAVSAGGVMSDEELSVPINLRPLIWETTAFRVLAVAFGFFVAFLVVQSRFAAQRTRERLLDSKVRSRTKELAKERDRAAEAFRVIEAQAKKLEQLDATKSKFFANVSHEFRTPLTLILGPLEDLLDQRHGEVSAEIETQIRLAADNGSRLLRLVNQLLDTARLDAGRLTLRAQEEDLAAFLLRMGEIFKPLAERNSVQFDIRIAESLPNAWIDLEQFEKVLVNLLGNAFKFTPAEGRVTLEADHQGGEISIRVRDSGPGIPKQNQAKVFDRFYQVEEPSAQLQAGTGIGLALARELVLLHHGSIELESEAGAGAMFEVRLPIGNDHLTPVEMVSKAESPIERRLREARMDESARRIVLDRDPTAHATTTTEAEPVAGGDSDRTTVLVVEDNEEMREYIRSRLAPDYRVIEAQDGQQALDHLAVQLPDLILSDLMMPRLDGIELCERVKRDPELDFVPFILLTAKASVESRISGFRKGADEYLAKPFDSRELLARVHNLIDSRRRLKRRIESKEESLPQVASQDDALVQQLNECIDARLSDDSFGIDELAHALGQSRRTLYRRLDALQLSPKEIILKRRLEQAAALLKENRGNVTDVAYAVGFRSVSHFSRRFREHHGATPTEYRKRLNG